MKKIQCNVAQSQSQRRQNWNNSLENSRFHGRGQVGFRGRGRSGFGRGRGRSERPIHQVCGKTGHLALDCWHKFDRQYTSSGARSNNMQLVPHQFRPHANLSMGNALATPTTIYDPN